MLRESAFWRVTDLLTQSYELHSSGSVLGARILLRGAYETLATLIYLNYLMKQTVEGNLDFHTFGEKTGTLLLGSRNGTTPERSINVLSVIEKSDKRYPGLMKIYEDLSESAHPSYEGLCVGYSKIDHNDFVTAFSNRWVELHGENHLNGMLLCMNTFHLEYDEVWPDLMQVLETWIVENDAELEASYPNSASP